MKFSFKYVQGRRQVTVKTTKEIKFYQLSMQNRIPSLEREFGLMTSKSSHALSHEKRSKAKTTEMKKGGHASAGSQQVEFKLW